MVRSIVLFTADRSDFLFTTSVADCELPRQTVLGEQTTAQRFAFMLAPIDCRTAATASATRDHSDSRFLLAPNRLCIDATAESCRPSNRFASMVALLESLNPRKGCQHTIRVE
jgi:hypothetical protein